MQVHLVFPWVETGVVLIWNLQIYLGGLTNNRMTFVDHIKLIVSRLARILYLHVQDVV
jgi:hypothetical protein